MIDFLKEYEFAVQVFGDEFGDLGLAILHFGPERWTHIDFGFGVRSKINELVEGKLPHSQGCKRRWSAIYAIR